MASPSRQNAAKARGLLDTWLRQKYKKSKVQPHSRCGTKVAGFQRAAHHSPRSQTADSSGKRPALDKLAAFRLWMFDSGMMASKREEYRQQIRECCERFDAMLAKESAKARVRRDGKRGGGTGDNFTISKKPKKHANHH